MGWQKRGCYMINVFSFNFKKIWQSKIQGGKLKKNSLYPFDKIYVYLKGRLSQTLLPAAEPAAQPWGMKGWTVCRENDGTTRKHYVSLYFLNQV